MLRIAELALLLILTGVRDRLPLDRVLNTSAPHRVEDELLNFSFASLQKLPLVSEDEPALHLKPFLPRLKEANTAYELFAHPTASEHSGVSSDEGGGRGSSSASGGAPISSAASASSAAGSGGVLGASFLLGGGPPAQHQVHHPSSTTTPAPQQHPHPVSLDSALQRCIERLIARCEPGALNLARSVCEAFCFDSKDVDLAAAILLVADGRRAEVDPGLLLNSANPPVGGNGPPEQRQAVLEKWAKTYAGAFANSGPIF